MASLNFEKMKVSELQELLDKYKISYDKKDKKEKLIQLLKDANIDAIEKDTSKVVNDMLDKTKENLANLSTSQSSSINQYSENRSSFDSGTYIPDSYNKNKLVFLVRDPHWGYVYWEFESSYYMQHNLSNVDKYLRVYDISESDNPDNPSGYFDIRLNDEANNWYIKFPLSNRTYIIDFGYFKDGQFITVLRSNKGYAPREDVSDQVDLEWMTNEDMYASMLKASGVDRLFEKIGSQEMVKFVASNVKEEGDFSSGGLPLNLSSFSLGNNPSSGSVSASGKKVK